jgi:predicted metal-dependent phosphoesterase TrpH
MLIDLHTHSHPSSWDSFLSPDDLVDRTKQAGLDGMVLTEHDWAWDATEVEALAKRHDFLVLRAIEINTEDGHILVYGVHEYIFGMHRAHELARIVTERGGIMVAAHPYRRQHPWDWENEREWATALERAAQNPAYRLVQAMERVNGRGKRNENLFAHRVAGELGFPGTAGSDSHAVEDIGKAATYFERDIHTEQDLIDELRAGRCWPVDRTAGSLTEVAAYHQPPANLDAALREIEERRAAFLASAPTS